MSDSQKICKCDYYGVLCEHLADVVSKKGETELTYAMAEEALDCCLDINSQHCSFVMEPPLRFFFNMDEVHAYKEFYFKLTGKLSKLPHGTKLNFDLIEQYLKTVRDHVCQMSCAMGCERIDLGKLSHEICKDDRLLDPCFEVGKLNDAQRIYIILALVGKCSAHPMYFSPRPIGILTQFILDELQRRA